MDTEFRKAFNAAFTPEVYERYLAELSRRLDVTFEFRNAETPVFFPAALRDRFAEAAHGILAQLRDPVRLQRMRRAIPARWDTPGMDEVPSFTQIDLAVVAGPDGGYVPKLIELQGFPSLTALKVIATDVWAEMLPAMPGLNRKWSSWFSGLDRAAFLDLARRTIVGRHDPAHVILMDLDPPTQKTLSDFIATRQLFGVDAVCPTALVKKGRTLWRPAPDGSGGLWPVRRIYNRVVFDELIKKGTQLPFDFRDDLDVEWTPHPNWYWVYSKNSLPFLDHPAVPRATLLSELAEFPADPAKTHVLKPLFSFAGSGVNVEPTRADLEKIPTADRSSWCLQEKIEYAPCLRTPTGEGVKVEIRMMFLKPPDAKDPVLALNLCRLSRGKLHGVDFNRNFTWVGSSVGLWAAEA